MRTVGTAVGLVVGAAGGLLVRLTSVADRLVTTKVWDSTLLLRSSLVGPGGGPQRVRMPYVERLAASLSDRDWGIIETLDRVHIASGKQIERLHFSALPIRSRHVMRWRVLKRLTDARVLAALDGRVGGARRGSAGYCYVLDSAGQQLARLRSNAADTNARQRRPRTPGQRFVSHAVAVTELFTKLVEHSQHGQFRLADFEIEPAWADGLGGWLRPDALVQLSRGDTTDYWWLEVDLSTESLPTVQRKLEGYLDFFQRGQIGPDGVIPRVLVGVPDQPRLSALQGVVRNLPVPAEKLFEVALLADASKVMSDELARVTESV